MWLPIQIIRYSNTYANILILPVAQKALQYFITAIYISFIVILSQNSGYNDVSNLNVSYGNSPYTISSALAKKE